MSLKNLVLFTGIWANLLIAAYAWLNADNSVIFWQTMARLSGRVSLGLFGLLFINESLKLFRPQQAFQSDFWEEKTLFPAFALHHFLHLGFLATFLYLSQAEIIVYRLLGGALAYFLILLLPILLYWRPRFISQSLRYFYLYYVWFVMFMTYIARVRGTLAVAGGTMTEHIFFFSIVLLLLAFNLILLINQFIFKLKMN
jgi:hypothetical protein